MPCQMVGLWIVFGFRALKNPQNQRKIPIQKLFRFREFLFCEMRIQVTDGGGGLWVHVDIQNTLYPAKPKRAKIAAAGNFAKFSTIF
jgi:hypothetical protein